MHTPNQQDNTQSLLQLSGFSQLSSKNFTLLSASVNKAQPTDPSKKFGSQILECKAENIDMRLNSSFEAKGTEQDKVLSQIQTASSKNQAKSLSIKFANDLILYLQQLRKAIESRKPLAQEEQIMKCLSLMQEHLKTHLVVGTDTQPQKLPPDQKQSRSQHQNPQCSQQQSMEKIVSLSQRQWLYFISLEEQKQKLERKVKKAIGYLKMLENRNMNLQNRIKELMATVSHSQHKLQFNHIKSGLIEKDHSLLLAKCKQFVQRSFPYCLNLDQSINPSSSSSSFSSSSNILHRDAITQDISLFSAEIALLEQSFVSILEWQNSCQKTKSRSQLKQKRKVVNEEARSSYSEVIKIDRSQPLIGDSNSRFSMLYAQIEYAHGEDTQQQISK